MLQYNISDFEDANEFMSQMAVKMGSLKKGGVPDIHKAAQRVLSDWTHGKLTYFTEPPERINDIINTELVTQMKEAFDIDALLNIEDEHLKDLESTSHDESTSSQLNIIEDNISENENIHAEPMDEHDKNYQTTAKTANQVFYLDNFPLLLMIFCQGPFYCSANRQNKTFSETKSS